jgi:RNA polymerase sigma-70 factor, ECF subfamily
MRQSSDERNREEVGWAQSCAQGDRDAFRRLFQSYRDPIFRLAFRFSNDKDAAEDLTQEIFIRLFERIGSYREEASFSTWFYRLATHVCLNRLRGCRNTERLEDIPNEPPDSSPGPDTCFEGREFADRVSEALNTLPEGERTAFILIALEGLEYAEAAEVLDLTLDAVRMRMSRARRALRLRLGPLLTPEGER